MPIDRRRFLQASAISFAAPALIGRAAGQTRRWPDTPFKLGVASGSPRPDGFVLWTRLATDPLSSDPDRIGGLTGGAIDIAYEIATDPELRNVVRRGATSADPSL